MTFPSPNRIAVVLTAAANLIGGISPIVANLDVKSTTSIFGALVLVNGVVLKWLHGWQADERRRHETALATAKGEANIVTYNSAIGSKSSQKDETPDLSLDSADQPPATPLAAPAVEVAPPAGA